MSDATRDALDEFYKSMYKRTRNTGRAGNRPWSRALHMDSLAVHPSQIKEAVEHARKNGVPTDYDSQGRPIVTDRNHRKQLCNLLGVFDKDGGYGDSQQGTTRATREGWGQEDLPDYSHLTEGAFKEAVDYRRTLG